MSAASDFLKLVAFAIAMIAAIVFSRQVKKKDEELKRLRDENFRLQDENDRLRERFDDSRYAGSDSDEDDYA